MIADPTQATAFLDNITASEKLTDGPITVGTSFRETRLMKGREATAELTVTAHQPDSHVAISSEAEGISVTYDYRIAAEGDGTRVVWTCQLEAGGLRKALLPVVAAIMKKEDGDHLRQLKAYLENR